MERTTDILADQCESVAQLLKAIAHPQRLKILCRLVEGECSVSELEASCEASQSSVSQYLGRMKLEGLLRSRRDGQSVVYEIGNPELLKLMRAMHKIFRS